MPQATPFFEAMNTYFFPNLGLGNINTSQFLDTFHTDFKFYDTEKIINFLETQKGIVFPENTNFFDKISMIVGKKIGKKIQNSSFEEWKMINDFYEKLEMQEEEERKTQQTINSLEREIYEYFGY